MTFTGLIGTICMFPLRAIIAACVALRIHPNILTFVGVLINSWAAVGRSARATSSRAGFIMIVANIFDFIDGKVAHITGTMSKFGGFWDSVIDRFSDIALFIGLIYLYSTLGRTDYVMVASFAMMFALMTSYTRARAESLIAKCKVGFMERPERIVLFMIGAFTNRMAGVLWVILRAVGLLGRRPRHPDLSRAREAAGAPDVDAAAPLPVRMLWNAFFWTFERATWQYDVMVIAILAFVWLTPPGWLGDPMAHGTGPDRVARSIAYGEGSATSNAPTSKQSSELAVGFGIGSCVSVHAVDVVRRHLVRRAAQVQCLSR